MAFAHLRLCAFLLAICSYCTNAAIDYTDIKAKALALNYTADTTDTAGYMLLAREAQYNWTIQTQVRLLYMYELNTAAQYLTMGVQLLSLWNDTRLACGAPGSSDDSRGWDPTYCADNPCFVHPPLVSPLTWARSFGPTVRPVLCSGGSGTAPTNLLTQPSVDELEDLRKMFWNPSFQPSGCDGGGGVTTLQCPSWGIAKSNTQLSAPILGAALPQGGSKDSGHVTLFTAEQRLVTVDIAMDLEKYPFDTQIIKILFRPPTVSSTEADVYTLHNYMHDPNVLIGGVPVNANGDAGTNLVGTFVTGFKVTDVSSEVAEFKAPLTNEDTPQVYLGILLTIKAQRVGSPLFWQYGVTSILIHILSWCLLFVDARVPPARASVIVAQVVLMIITSNLHISVRGKLPDAAGLCFMGVFILVSVFLQGINLATHVNRLWLATDALNKVEGAQARLDTLTTTARIFSAGAWIIAEVCVILAYHEFTAGLAAFIIFMVVLLSVVTTVSMALILWKHMKHDPYLCRALWGTCSILPLFPCPSEPTGTDVDSVSVSVSTPVAATKEANPTVEMSMGNGLVKRNRLQPNDDGDSVMAVTI
jgi:hypothetical protein